MTADQQLAAARRAFDAVLFDMGGVLLEMGNGSGRPEGESDRLGRDLVLGLLVRSGGRCSADELEATLFAPWRQDYARRYQSAREASWAPHLERLRRVTGAAATDEEILATWFGPYAEHLCPLPGARRIPRLLRAAGLRLAVVSNVPLPGFLYRRRLTELELAEPFSRLLFSYDAGSRKPAPGMLEDALATLGVRAERAVMIGDRRFTDVAAGRAAGAATVWLSSDLRPGPSPDGVIETLLELPKVLAELARRRAVGADGSELGLGSSGEG